MHIRRLQLAGFRNYGHLDLEAGPGRLLFAGDNAQGKSNLLEAIHLLATGRSIRAGGDGEMIGWQAETDMQPFARVSGDIVRHADDTHVELLILGATAQNLGPAQRAGKRYRVNGVPRRAIDFVGQLRAVLFTADDLDVVSGSPSLRRNYLDAALCQMDRAYYGALQRYGRVMQQRNATLRRIREGVAGIDELTLWEDNFTQDGATIIAGRQRAIQLLTATASELHRDLAGEAQEHLDLTYEPQLGEEWRRMLTPDARPQEVQPLFAAALAAQRRRETAAGVSLVGPHRDELKISLNGVSAASFGSRAQIRTAALTLRLAEARLLIGEGGDPPVLLLDDIVSELDERRRRSVLAGLAGFDQVWFTAATGSWLPPEFVDGCRVYEVSAGRVSPRES